MGWKSYPEAAHSSVTNWPQGRWGWWCKGQGIPLAATIALTSPLTLMLSDPSLCLTPAPTPILMLWFPTRLQASEDRDPSPAPEHPLLAPGPSPEEAVSCG